jgi:DNA polymerase-3 subunit beta
VLAIDGEIGDVEISGADLLSLLSPLPAADTEPTRFHLCGVFWHNVGDKLVAVSTNGRRLIRACVTASQFSEGRDLIVASETAAALLRIIKSTKPGRVTLRRSRTLLAVIGPDFCFTSRLVEGKFPAYEAVIPAASPNTIICDRTELVAALARLAAVATVEPSLLALSFDGAPQLEVSLARQPDDGRDAIGAETVGDAKVALPLRQLADMLEEFRGDRIHLDAASGKPLVLRGEDKKLALIMPSAWNFGNKEEAAA